MLAEEERWRGKRGEECHVRKLREGGEWSMNRVYMCVERRERRG